jgi:trimethylamine---corrinoid protein Co-methyltransferase
MILNLTEKIVYDNIIITCYTLNRGFRMHVAGHAYSLLSTQEVERIHLGAMRLLREMGMQIQNDELLQVIADFGLPVDFAEQRVRFPTSWVERFLSEAKKFDWEDLVPQVGGSAGVYHGRFHDPQSGDLVPWSEVNMAYYFALANQLPHLSGAQMLGCRLPVPASLEPLYERYYCWKYGASEGSSIYSDEICPYLHELYQAHADAMTKPIGDVFQATVYLVPALKLGRHEAYQVAYFRERGLRVFIGGMLAMGASAPMTLAGAVTLNLAESLALRLLDWALFGVQELRLGGSISVMDMRTMIYPYGRPEMAIANLMIAQMARHYGAYYSGHAGLSDAKLPSVESGYQKALTALPTLLACGSLWMDAGLLSIDEVCSPVQLILDNEFLSALKHLAKEFSVSDDAIGLETILEAGPGGQYLDKEHTVRYLRSEHWQPKIWSREMLTPWLDRTSPTSRRLDVDLAREIALEVRHTTSLASHLSDADERALLCVIDHAGQRLV